MVEQKKFAFFLPNCFTALNMACGFWSIIWGIQGKFFEASLLLILGAIFDSVDGRVARLTGTQSNFGEQFDSLSDLITFGMAPAIIFYHMFLIDLGRPGIVIAFLYLLCGALRLARFNANIDKVSSDYFQGLPIPGSALCVISFVMITTSIGPLPFIKSIAIAYLIFYSLLMISTIPFCSFKNSDWVKRHKRATLALIFLIIAVLLINIQLFLVILVNLYVVSSIGYYLKNREKFKGLFQWQND